MPVISHPEAFIKIRAEFAIPGVFAWMNSARDVPNLPFKPPLLQDWPHMATYLKTLFMKHLLCKSDTVVGASQAKLPNADAR